MANLKGNQIPKGRRVEPVEVWGAKKRVSRSGEKFASALNELGKNMEGNFKLFTKQQALKIFAGIIKEHPVKTGYARFNWFFGITPTKEIKPKIENAGDNSYPVPSVGEASKSTSASYIYFLNNNLPYIEALEAGSSNQQPTGFIANTIFRIAKDMQRSKK